MTTGESPATDATEVYERLDDAVFGLDGDWQVTFGNDAALDLLGSGEPIVGSSIWRLLPDRGAARKQFEYAAATETPVDFEVELDGAWVEFRVFPAENGVSVYARDITERRRRERAVQAGYELAAKRQPFDARLDDAMELLQWGLDVPYAGAVSTVGDRSIEAWQGEADDDVQTFARELAGDIDFDGGLATGDPGEHPTGGYAVVPATVDGDDYGTVGVYGRERPFAEWEHTFVRQVGAWLVAALEQTRHIQELSALNELNAVVRDVLGAVVEQSSRAAIEQTVCERLAESDSYEFAWIGAVDERSGDVRPVASARLDGYLDGVSVSVDPDVKHGQGPAGRAYRSGTVAATRDIERSESFSPWREAAAARGVRASATVPLGVDGEHGLLSVYSARPSAFDEDERRVIQQLGEMVGLAITAVERERDVQHQRERLEFINRLLRHNVLNGLNILNLRSDILAREFDNPDASEHIDIIRDRVDDMSTLVDTIERFADAVADQQAKRCDPVALVPVLEQKVELAHTAHPNATVTFDSPEDVEVVADDLLGEVFENVLSNAIAHNDSDEPHVAVSVHETTHETPVDPDTGQPTPLVDTRDDRREAPVREWPAVRVDVADNGPGIPDEQKEYVLNKGVSELSEPGNGFGLYLVSETVELYGGSVSIRDNDPRGTVVSVTLLCAPDA